MREAPPGTSTLERLLLIRHGQIEANVSGIWHGSTDSALTALGVEQAERVARFVAEAYPEAAALYTSPLERTRDTAAPIATALGVEPRPDAGLAEYGIGELEGVSYQALIDEHRFFARIQRDPDYAPPGGESPRQVVQRFIASIERIRAEHAGTVVVVTHGAASALALAQLVDGNALAWRDYHSSNCGVTELALDEAPRIVRFDQTDHLG